MRGRIAFFAPLLTIFLVGCERAAPPVAALPPPKVTVSRPIERSVLEYEEFTGYVESIEKVDVRAQVSGYLDKVNFVEGQEVKKGALLYVIDQRPYRADLAQAEAELLRAQARVKRTSSDYERNRVARSRGVISQEDYDKFLADRDESIAAERAAHAAVEKANLNLDFTEVKAPIDGQISRTNITVGNLVSAGSGINQGVLGSPILTTIVSMQPMYVYFDASEASLLRYERRTPKNIRRGHLRQQEIPVELALGDEPDFRRKGVLDFADNQVDISTGTIRLRGVFDNEDRLLNSGMFVRVRVPVGVPHKALLVTERAIGTDQGRKYVLVVGDKNVVEYRPVRVGVLEGGMRAVEEGLKPGDWVVVNGLQRARPGVAVDPDRVAMPAQAAAPSPPAGRGGTAPNPVAS